MKLAAIASVLTIFHLPVATCFHTTAPMRSSHIAGLKGQLIPSNYRNPHEFTSFHTRCVIAGPLKMAPPNSLADTDEGEGTTTNWARFSFLATAGFLYWYIMVFGAAAQANGLPIPDFVPMTPGWPATDADFVPVVEDSYHFFYLSEILQNPDAPYVIPPRLSIFNFVSAWIFAMLPALWRDTQRRLPRPILLGSWLLLGLGLTNAFLAPYLAITELRGGQPNEGIITGDEDEPDVAGKKNSIIAGIFGGVSTAVVGYALIQATVGSTAADWSEFGHLVQTDRSYFAFCVDPLLFSLFQPVLLGRIKKALLPIDYVPYVGLILWLFGKEEEGKTTTT